MLVVMWYRWYDFNLTLPSPFRFLFCFSIVFYCSISEVVYYISGYSTGSTCENEWAVEVRGIGTRQTTLQQKLQLDQLWLTRTHSASSDPHRCPGRSRSPGKYNIKQALQEWTVDETDKNKTSNYAIQESIPVGCLLLTFVVLAGVYATPPEGTWDHRYPYAPLQKDMGPGTSDTLPPALVNWHTHYLPATSGSINCVTFVHFTAKDWCSGGSSWSNSNKSLRHLENT